MESAPSGAVAAGALASSAIIAEGIQIAGTALLLALGQQWTGAQTPVELVSMLITSIQDLGAQGYVVFAAMMIFFQVVPIAAAFILTVSAGAIFGGVKGTAMVLTCSTISASISFAFSRSVGRRLVLEAAQESPQFQAIDEAFSSASYSTSLLLIGLLRLSHAPPVRGRRRRLRLALGHGPGRPRAQPLRRGGVLWPRCPRHTLRRREEGELAAACHPAGRSCPSLGQTTYSGPFPLVGDVVCPA